MNQIQKEWLSGVDAAPVPQAEVVLGTGKRKLPTVPVEDLWPNPWNPNEQSPFIFGKEKASIRRFGFCVPVVVRRCGPENPPGHGFHETEHLQIIDGAHRWKAAYALGLQEITYIDMGVVSDERAKSLTVVLNETKGQSDATKLSKLISDIVESVGSPDYHSPEDADLVMDVMPYTSDEIEGLLDLTKFEWEDAGKAGSTTGAQGGDGSKPTSVTHARIAVANNVWRVPKDKASRLADALKLWIEAHQGSPDIAFDALSASIEKRLSSDG